MHILVDTAEVATMGFVETFGTLGRLLATYRQLKRFMIEERPALLVLIDYPEFNLFLAKRAKALGIPVFYYIGPQVWAWRRGRVRKIARRVDRLGVVFPFEPELLQQRPSTGGVRRPPAARPGACDALARGDVGALSPRSRAPRARAAAGQPQEGDSPAAAARGRRGAAAATRAAGSR